MKIQIGRPSCRSKTKPDGEVIRMIRMIRIISQHRFEPCPEAGGKMIKPGRQIDLKPGAPASNQRRHHRLCGIDISKTERRWRMIKRDIKLPVPGSGDSSRAAGFFSDDAGRSLPP